jgi:hypothetical protein
MLQPEEASTDEEGALKRKALTDGVEACTTERIAEDGCSMKNDQAEAAKKAGMSEFLDQGGDATVVADQITDEEEKDDGNAKCPFDQVNHVDGKMMEGEEEEEGDDEEDHDDFTSNAFYAECKADAQFLDQGVGATVVADELTDEEDDDVYSPFDCAFLDECKARHEEEFQELLAEMMI